MSAEDRLICWRSGVRLCRSIDRAVNALQVVEHTGRLPFRGTLPEAERVAAAALRDVSQALTDVGRCVPEGVFPASHHDSTLYTRVNARSYRETIERLRAIRADLDRSVSG